jgi:hypothetical protein
MNKPIPYPIVKEFMMGAGPGSLKVSLYKSPKGNYIIGLGSVEELHIVFHEKDLLEIQQEIDKLKKKAMQ